MPLTLVCWSISYRHYRSVRTCASCFVCGAYVCAYARVNALSPISAVTPLGRAYVGVSHASWRCILLKGTETAFNTNPLKQLILDVLEICFDAYWIRNCSNLLFTKAGFWVNLRPQ